MNILLGAIATTALFVVALVAEDAFKRWKRRQG
jgi:hypothetical protein